MAIFKRVNLTTLSLLNYSYNKFTTVTVKLETRRHFAVSLNRPLAEKHIRRTKIENSPKKLSPFETKINRRRDEARRSILVQVHLSASQKDLQNYCTKFGTVENMHYFKTNKERHFMLVEFTEEESVKEIISHASFRDAELIIPVKSSVLWFRKENNKQNSQTELEPDTQYNILYPNLKQMTHILHHSDSVSEQIIKLYNALKLSDLEIRLRFHTAHHLEQYFSGLFYGMKVLPFGSSINGFGRKKCDLDLVLVSNDTKESNTNSRLIFHSKEMKFNERYETKEFMALLANIMQQFVPGVQNVRRILEARVPIIKFNFEYNHLECDLSTTNMAAVYMSELLNLYGEVDMRVRPLVIFIRTWAKVHKITNDTPGPWITNFSLSLLVLFYLQQKNILPSLRTLRIYASPEDMRHTKNGIDCTFMRDINKLPSEYQCKLNEENLANLLYGFFEYYSTFDFYTKGICIREGIPIRKPSHMALHIVNPFETTMNVSKNVNIYELNRLIEKVHDTIFRLEVSNKSKCINWGLLSILQINMGSDTTDSKSRNVESSRLDVKDKVVNDRSIKEKSQENHSLEISEKIVNVDDVDTRPEKKEEIV